MTLEGLGEMFEGDFADTLDDKFPLMLMGGRAEELACANPGARTTIGVSGMFSFFCSLSVLVVFVRAVAGLGVGKISNNWFIC